MNSIQQIATPLIQQLINSRYSKFLVVWGILTLCLQDQICSQPTAWNNPTSYCNPIDIDYTYMSHYRARNNVSYRSGADPAIVNFKGKYYLFVTRSHGYWVSEDMNKWKFIRPQSW